MTRAEPVLLALDARRRLSLGTMAQHDRYLVTVEPDGVIVLTPAVVMSTTQARLLAEAETVNAIDKFLHHPPAASSRPRRPRPPR